MIKFFKYILFICFIGMLLLLLQSCKKEKLPLQFESCAITHNLPLYGIAQHNNKFWICGGKTKNSGFIYSSFSWNGPWNLVYSNDTACIYDVFFVNDSTGFACGDKLLILKTTDAGKNWFSCFNWFKPYHQGYHVPLRKIFFITERIGFIVGGDLGDKGLIYKTIDGYDKWDFLEIEHEIRDIYFCDDDYLFVVGNGLIFQCNNDLQNGQMHDFSGDFLMSVAQYNHKLYAVGYSGGIFENNFNNNWKTIKKPSSLFEKRQHYNKIFSDTRQLIIIGNKGIVELSGDGKKWQTFYSCDGSDLLNGIFYNGQIYVISRNGMIYKLDVK